MAMSRIGSVARTAVAVCAAMACTVVAGCAPGPGAEDGVVTIYLARHGESWLNAVDRAQGWSDAPLTDAGQDQATALGDGLEAAGVDVDAAYTADMVRHSETAEFALAAMGEDDLEPVPDERLREMAFGRWEGSTSQEMWTRIAELLGYPDRAALSADLPHLSLRDVFDSVAPQMQGDGELYETGTAVAERAMAALDAIADAESQGGGGEVLVVSSGLTIVMALIALGAEPTSLSGGIHNGAVSELRYDDGAWTIVSMNDESYVAGAH
ncbi:histidine phosphatase family protein [Cellulomonas taurus]|uniref:histidine phosphatase family protein n=1 Tax=Cellulomonas taurus TaxID=2729175 RepID=UPI00145E2809|nr:histidine phosphatase family protein [Cellulomonas taurus]